MPIRTDPSEGVASPPQLRPSPDRERLSALAEFRAGLRKFLYFSELAAEKSGLTTQRFQALLAVQAHFDQHQTDMTVGELSASLLIKEHSAAELVARLVEDHFFTLEAPPLRIGALDLPADLAEGRYRVLTEEDRTALFS